MKNVTIVLYVIVTFFMRLFENLITVLFSWLNFIQK